MTYRVLCDEVAIDREFNFLIAAEVVAETFTLEGKTCRIEEIDIDEEMANIQPLPGLPQTPRRKVGLGAVRRPERL